MKSFLVFLCKNEALQFVDQEEETKKKKKKGVDRRRFVIFVFWIIYITWLYI
jgi:hypothetical protein